MTEGADRRDENGRLYTAFDGALVTAALAGLATRHDSDSDSASSGRRVRRLIARKAD